MQLVAVGTRDAALPAPGFLSPHDAQGFGALVIPHHSSPTVDPGCRPQACVWAAMIVVHDPLGQHTPKMPFTERDHEVQTLAPNCSDQPFAVGILLRRPNRRFQYPITHPTSRTLPFTASTLP
jgi:hypothetical protein